MQEKIRHNVIMSDFLRTGKHGNWKRYIIIETSAAAGAIIRSEGMVLYG